jgi:hypothetical protein
MVLLLLSLCVKVFLAVGATSVAITVFIVAAIATEVAPAGM